MQYTNQTHKYLRHQYHKGRRTSLPNVVCLASELFGMDKLRSMPISD
jgi:hypothetical protein